MTFLQAFGSWKESWTEFHNVFGMIAALLYHLNFAVNFLVYNVSSKTFRSVAVDILVPKCLGQALQHERTLQIEVEDPSNF